MLVGRCGIIFYIPQEMQFYISHTPTTPRFEQSRIANYMGRTCRGHSDNPHIRRAGTSCKPYALLSTHPCTSLKRKERRKKNMILKRNGAACKYIFSLLYVASTWKYVYMCMELQHKPSEEFPAPTWSPLQFAACKNTLNYHGTWNRDMLDYRFNNGEVPSLHPLD